MVSDFFSKITNDQGSVEDIVRRIPGFKGYLEKNDRRAADRLLREHLVREFEEVQSEFMRLQRKLVNSGGMQYMERVQGINTNLQTFVDRIESAAQGYAGLFDAVKVKEDELARVYAFDEALIRYATQFSEGLEALEESIGNAELDTGNVLDQLEYVAIEANNTFKKRVEAMHALESSEG